MDKIRLGIIGTGGAGRAHAWRFLKNRHVQQVIGYNNKPTDFTDIEIENNLDSFLSQVEAVSICTPDDTHYEYIVMALQRGKHVLVEKPMVASYQEAIQLGDVLKQYPHLKFGVHHQMRFVPAFAKAKELMDKNAFGKVFYMEANYWHDMRERNTQFDDWRLTGKGQSVIFGGACHPLDLLLYLTEDEVVSHQTYLSKNAYRDYPLTYTSATTLIQFISGIVAKTHINNCVVYPQMNDLVILGDKASYINGIYFSGNGFQLRASFIGRHAPHLHQKIFHRISIDWLVSLLRKRPLFRNNPFSVYNHEHACRVIIDNFVEAVRNGAPVLVGYEDGLRVVRLCEEIEADGLIQGVFTV